MMGTVPRRLQKRILQSALLGLILLIVAYTVLPPDSAILQAIRFGAGQASALRGPAKDAWLEKPASQHIDLRKDVGYLIKTGYGTRHRVPLQLAALKGSYDDGLLGDEGKDFVVVGDWTTVDQQDAKKIGVPVHDVLKMMLKLEDGQWRGHARFKKYEALQDAIQAGKEQSALEIGRSVGWELDALKFMPGMELLHKAMPNKKWYVLLDDDTYVVKSTLQTLLSRLDSTKPYYLGNAVGNYRVRFAHGGSGILVSGEALRQLFQRRDVVRQTYLDSMDDQFGDRLVATALQKLGIHLDEKYAHYFNGEPPEGVRITRENHCSPILSFHGMRTEGAMEKLGKTVGALSKLVWGDMMELYRAPYSMKTARDYLGYTDQRVKTIGKVKRGEDCWRKCQIDNGDWCMSWMFDGSREECYVSPWVVPGSDGPAGRVSSYNQDALNHLRKRCP